MHHRILAFGRPPLALGIGHLALNRLLVRQRCAAPGLVLQHPHGVARVDECADDAGPTKPVAPVTAAS